jgi:hypothetical protein
MNNYLFETLGYVAQSVDKVFEDRTQENQERESGLEEYERN